MTNALFPRAPRALLRMDEILVQRPSPTADSEGNPSASRTTVPITHGTLSIARSSDILIAGQRGTRVDLILSLELGLDVRGGDFVTHGVHSYEVVEVVDRRLYRRAILRRVGS